MGPWLTARWLVVLVVGVSALLFGCILVFPRRLAPPRSEATLAQVSDPAERIRLVDERLKLQNDIRTALLQAVGGAAVLAGIFFTWQQLQTDRDQLRQQLIVTRQGQVAERFTRAIDQLSSGRLEVQLGGIYGLEQIARQAADDPQATSDRLQVYEVLAAYIRNHAAWSPAAPPLAKLGELQQRAPDVQAALTVLARRATSRNDPPLDLHGVDLRRAAASNANLVWVNLKGAHLEGASLGSARLEGASLQGAHLERTFLFDADLEGTHLEYAHLEGAILQQAHLAKATADKNTVRPKGFDWRAAGVTIR